MSVTFKWYELAKWITRGHIYFFESQRAKMHIDAHWEWSTGEEEVLSTFHPIMHHFAVMLACVRLSNTTDIAKRKQQKRK